MNDIILNIATDFTNLPGARYKTDSEKEDSGEHLFENHLFPKMQLGVENNILLKIDMDGCAGYALSFIDDAFGRLGAEFGETIVKKHLKTILCVRRPKISIGRLSDLIFLLIGGIGVICG